VVVVAGLGVGVPSTADGAGSAPIASLTSSALTSSAGEGREPCDKVKGTIWAVAALTLTMVPPFSVTNPFLMAGYVTGIGFYSRCFHFASDGEKVTVLTMDYLMSEIEKATGRQLDQVRLDSILDRAGDLYTTLEREKSALDHIDDLTPGERNRLATIMQTIGNDASLLEAEFDSLGWQSLPGVALVAGLKNAAYAMAYTLTDDSAYRDHLEMVVFPDERAESINRLAAKEAGLVRFVEDDLTTLRESSKRTSSGLVPTTWFEINAAAKRGDGFLYHKEWKCERRWHPKKECTDFESRRTEYFNAALSAHAHARAEVAELLDPGYLAVKNAISMYRGAPFSLVNNRVDNSTSTAVLEGKCLDVPGENETVSSGTGVQQWTCERGASNTDQVWRFVPGSGQLENVRSGMCLDVVGSPADQVDGSGVALADCVAADDLSAEHADQRWGIHPLGYLVNLSSGRCLDMAEPGTVANGAQAQVSPCHYGQSAGTANYTTSLARGASPGASPGDPATDQTWTLWYVGANLPGSRALMAAPPVETLPIAVDDTLTVVQDAPGTVIDVLANDPVPSNDLKTVLAVTDPVHGEAKVVQSGAAVSYTPDPGYCNDPGPVPADTFRYTLNGGSNAMVTVTVACAPVDQAPVAIADVTTVAQGSGPTTIDVLGNDADADGGPKHVVAVADPTHGTATIVGAGASVAYEPDPDYCNDPGAAPADEFTYSLNGGSTAAVAVTVTCADTTAPDTEITTRANIFGQTVLGSHKGTIAFRSPDPTATFECSLDASPFRACTSPADLVVARGRHNFEVRAVDRAGNVDASPARRVIQCNALF
jgi:hypothetical protein